MAEAKSASEFLDGHADFSAYISIDQDLQIYRRFTRLSARNLLHLQSELTMLEAWFDDFDQEEAKSLDAALEPQKMDIWMRNRNWETFVGLAEGGSDADTTREQRREQKRQAKKLEMVGRLKQTMAEYQEALIRQREFMSLARPDKGPLKVLREWYSRKRPLLGFEYDMLGNRADLVSVKNPGEKDTISRILRSNTGFMLGNIRKKSSHYPASWGDVYTFQEKHVERLIAVVSVVIAALLLVGAMVSLHFASSEGLRLSLVGVFTVVFAAAVGLLTSAKRSELFTATAASEPPGPPLAKKTWPAF